MTLRVYLPITLLLCVLSRTTESLESCLKEVDPSAYPLCKIVDHGTHGDASYECLDKWENSVFLHKDGNVTLECTAPFPIDMDYGGAKPIKNFHLEFYKELPANEAMTFGVKVHIVTKSMEYSGDYIFFPLDQPEKKVTVYVFAEKKDLPQFLELAEGKAMLEAYVDPAEPDAIVIPCRTANYNASILGVYYEYEDMKNEFDGVNLRYDPRRGFIRKIPPEDSDVQIYGHYECFTEWKGSGRDRMKIYATAPPSDDPPLSGEDEDEDAVTTTTTSTERPKPITYLTDTITFHPIHDKKFKAECTLPENAVRHHTPFFANALMHDPVSSRLNVKCSHLNSNCGEHVRIVGNITQPPNVLGIKVTQESGVIQCSADAAGTTVEILEYFTGADDHIYNDWNVALANQALVKVIPAQTYERYTVHGTFTFECHAAMYLAVYPVWWAISYENGTMIEEYESSTSKTYDLDLDANEIHCGVTLWNSSVWYKNSLTITVVDFVLPVLRVQDTRMSFKSDVPNQVLRCDVEPTPGTKLEWLRHGKKVDDIPTLDLGDSLVLFFQEMNSSYEGNYTCRASSKSASVDAEFQIILDEVKEEALPATDAENDTSETRNRTSTCNSFGEVKIFHRDNDSEVEFLENMAQNDLFILKFLPQEHCGNQTSGLKDSQIFVKLVSNETEAEIETPEILPGQNQSQDQSQNQSQDQGHSFIQLAETPEGILEEATGAGREEEVKEFKDEGTGYIRPKRRNKNYRYLLPLLTGLTVALLVVIMAYATYSYFVSPWKVRRISTVSSGPLI